MLTNLDRDLWIREEPLRFLGVDIGRIMTVLGLPGGDLLVHSPAELTDDLRTALDDRGSVRYVVPASKLHGHLHMEQYRDAYPEVELLAAPGLPGRRSDLTFDGLLGSVPDPRWAESVDQAAIQGNRFLPEIAFYHRPSSTLLLGDAGCEAPLHLRALARLAGVDGRVGPPPDFRATVTNESTLRRSIERLFEWEFDRIVPGHGSIVEGDARRRLREGYDWLL